MRIFSGRYPKDLAKVIEHAKRLKDLLDELERVRTDAWFLGRAGELRGVVGLAVADWRRGTRDAEAAGRTILTYVDELHRGASKRLRCGLALECCEGDDVITALGSDDAEAVSEMEAETTGVSRPTNGPTVPAGWVDSPEMLARFREGLELVEIHARTLARSVGSGPPTKDDLRGLGREGLLIAARTFDERHGVPFERWATVRIRNAIIDGMRSWGSTHARARSAPRDLSAAASDVRPSDVEEILDGSLAAGSAGAAAGIVDGWEGPSASPEELLVKAERESTVRNLVALLPNRERALIERTYFEGQPLEQAAAAMGVTRAWARRVHDRAIERIQGELRKRDAIAPGGSRCGRRRA
jgi:RNA polymerase sigma factor for flagellar operon FliA